MNTAWCTSNHRSRRQPVAGAALALIIAAAAGQLPPSAAAALPDNVFVQGTLLHGSFGLRFGPDGLLYVPSFAPGIVAIDADSGQMAGLIGAESGVQGPEDVAFGPDGSMYWSEMFVGTVARRAPDGTVTRQMVAPGVNPLAFSASGRLFVSVCWWADVLFELDPALTAPPRPVANNLGFLKGMEFGADGKLYGATILGGRIVRIDVEATPPSVEEVATGFAAPFTAKFDAQGKLIVVDRPVREVYLVDPADGSRTLLARTDFGVDNVAVDAQGRLFISSFSDGLVGELLPGGGVRPLLPGGMIMPSVPSVYARPDGESLFVANMFSLREFDTKSGALRATHRFAFAPPPAFGGAAAVAAGNGKLATVPFFPAPAVQVLDPATGNVLEDHRDFNVPINATFFEGDLVVVELGSAAGEAKVTRAGSGGRTTLADASTNIFVPVGLAAAGGNLWVSDWASGMVWQLAAGGQALVPARPVAAGLVGPEGLAVDRDGTLLVVEAGAGRLSRIDPSTGGVTELASGLALGLQGFGILPPFGLVNGVAVGGDGAIYVVGELANVVYRFVPRTSYIPAAAHGPGMGGSAWTTELGVHNPGTTQAHYVVQLLKTDTANSSPETASFILAGGSSARYPDALAALFDHTGTGALRVTSVDGDLRVTASTVNTKAGRRMGQFVEGVADGMAITAGQEARLVHLTNSGSHRTNVGMVNAAGVPIEVNLEFFKADATHIGAATFSLAPFAHVQQHDVFSHLTTLSVHAAALAEIDDAYAVLTCTTPGARYFAYASVVDNFSGSPLHIPAR